MGLCVYACACACAHMVTDSGQREGVRGHRTGERTAGQQETGQDRNRRYRGQQEDRTAGDSDGQGDRERGTETAGQERERERTATRDYSRTGGLKRTSTIIVMQ